MSTELTSSYTSPAFANASAIPQALDKSYLSQFQRDALVEAGFTFSACFVALLARGFLQRWLPHPVVRRFTRTAKVKGAFPRSPVQGSQQKGKESDSSLISPRFARAEAWNAKKFSMAWRANGNDDAMFSAAPAAPVVPQAASSSSTTWRLNNNLSSETDILATAVREGKAYQLPLLLDAARERALDWNHDEASMRAIEAEHLFSSLRACASRRCFPEALAIYDHLAHRIGEANSRVWSLLLYCSAETGDVGRCHEFTLKLCAMGCPTGLDFVNIVRCYAYSRDGEGLRRTMAVLEGLGLNVDGASLNRAFSICASASALDLADILLNHEVCAEGLDTVGYNTLMRAHAQAGHPERCYALFENFRGSGLSPSAMTFGILLDACIDARDFERARQTFAHLRRSGLTPNVVHYTTFMKGLVKAKELDAADALLEEMLASRGETQPDLVTYTTLVKAHSDCGDIKGVLRVLDRMREQGVASDPIILDIAMTGCCAKPMEAANVLHVLRFLMARHNLQPSTTTLSIVVKAFAQTSAWQEALDLLDTAKERLGVAVEPRIFLQLAQACSRGKCSHRVLAVYAAMEKATRVDGLVMDDATNLRIYRLCTSVGQKVGAQKIREQLSKTREQ
eukprot:CAMPEP_0170595660 /NCGR_PEP_ID=MMETSP0224-20130122/14685_1 /TAXON_ID=285029 /ORGANISM="Togula jolla, Strain CCCM 725" /LENGTH=623 /DNA_ID=CAMNT_0010919865 /DNA_START=138 /DNA_END=2009 /DNA_ORIENTATION=+